MSQIPKSASEKLRLRTFVAAFVATLCRTTANPTKFTAKHAAESSFRRVFRTGFKTILCLLLALLPLGCAVPGAPSGCPHTGTSPAPPPAKAVRVFAKREGDVTRFYVENKEFCEITMTFEMTLVNLRGEKQFPCTMTFPARQVSEAFALSPIKAGVKSEYSFTTCYKLGSNCARHDDFFAYQLPYSPGARYKVTQGFNGSFSHKGPDRYAVDWKMAEGTLVRAARGGIVVRVKDESSLGGPSMKFDHYNNYVLIRHDDGTLGQYCHLQKGGCVVEPGQVVAAGQVIARSGNTGFSSGPHLHFCVFKTKNGRERESLPVKFKTDTGNLVIPTEGHSYRAPEIQSASARSSSPAAGIQVSVIR